jgi:hypothetical protein
MQDSCFAHAVVIVNGEAPPRNLLHDRLHDASLRAFARLMGQYTRPLRRNFLADSFEYSALRYGNLRGRLAFRYIG